MNTIRNGFCKLDYQLKKYIHSNPRQLNDDNNIKVNINMQTREI